MSSENNNSSYKELSPSLKRQGFIYRQLVRSGKWAIYAQYAKNPERLVAYEVVKIGRHNGFSIAGMFFPPAETYPTSSMWGSHGWTYSKIDDAKKSFSEKLTSDGGVGITDIFEDFEILGEMYKESEGDTSSL
jgi:hypothetical protein